MSTDEFLKQTKFFNSGKVNNLEPGCGFASSLVSIVEQLRSIDNIKDHNTDNYYNALSELSARITKLQNNKPNSYKKYSSVLEDLQKQIVVDVGARGYLSNP